MSPEKQRIAIAIACGWTNVKPVVVQNVKHQGDDITVGISSDSGWIPDYLNDLNATQEVKKVLWDKGLLLEFVNQLVSITYSAMGFRWEKLTTDDHLILVATATAEQEAEAFLRALGLWEKEVNEPRTEEADVATVIPDPLADMRARAEAGDRHAQCTLGDAYAHGMEVAKDRVESDRWYAMFSAPFPLTTPEPELNPATEESSATGSEPLPNGTTYTRSYQVFLPTPTPIQTKPIFTTSTPNPHNQ